MPAHQLTTECDRPDIPDLTPRREGAWAQNNAEFAAWADAPRIVQQHLRPILPPGRWWFIRKHPHWRLRHQPHDPDPLPQRLDALTTAGVLRGWHPSTYEPETHAFGGPAAMNLAHALFCRDSPIALALALTQPIRPLVAGRRAEVSVLAITRMLRAAALEPYEQGDVWALVADLRDGATANPAAPQPPDAFGLAAAVRRLVTLDTSPSSPLIVNGRLTPLRGWLDAFTTTGHHLADLARAGHLHRGLRAVLAYHVIFHWNRLALPTAHQHILAQLARDTLIPPDAPNHTTPR